MRRMPRSIRRIVSVSANAQLVVANVRAMRASMECGIRPKIARGSDPEK